ncbi:hypothetical protein GCM10010203_56590 [Actinomadura yumaensis]|jgi:hypothetical protein
MKTRYVIAIGAGVATLVALAGARLILHDWLTVDACYDDGGVFLKEIGKCSHSQAEVDSYRPRSNRPAEVR